MYKKCLYIMKHKVQFAHKMLVLRVQESGWKYNLSIFTYIILQLLHV